MGDVQLSDPTLVEVLAERYHERVSPEPGDQAYTHLLDLRDALADVLRDARGRWLDFGSGTAPYRDLFAGAALETADLPGGETSAVDHELGHDGRCAVPDSTFDGVLSTQVLEHVPDPHAYLAEAYRILRPGGRLVLTTHGVWEHHGGDDYRRWTAQGLAHELAAAGFDVASAEQLTCDARALLLLLTRSCRAGAWPSGGVVGLLLRTLGLVERRRPGTFDAYAERRLAHLRRREGDHAGFSIALLVDARKPAVRPQVV